jgi:hypothetical protein
MDSDYLECCLWDIAQCSAYMNRRFGGMYHLHLQGRKFSRARNQRAAGTLFKSGSTIIFPRRSNGKEARNRIVAVYNILTKCYFVDKIKEILVNPKERDHLGDVIFECLDLL